MPLIPSQMLGFTEGKYYPGKTPFSIDSNNVLPLGLTLLVYQIDCWCLFRSILKFLTSASIELSASPNGRMLSRDLASAIPLWAHPHSLYSEDIVTYLINDRFVTLFPFSYIDPECGDISSGILANKDGSEPS